MDTDALTPRQREIVRLVRKQSYATLEMLAQHFAVSMQSIRRDVIHLDRVRLLQRFHGGAGVTPDTVRLGCGEKRVLASDAKARIGRAAADLIPRGAAVFLDEGTTTEALARTLAERGRPVRVFTNSLAIGMVLAGCPEVELHVLGGASRGADGSLAGAATLAAVDAIRFDLAFIGCSGFDAEGRVMDYDLEKIAVKRAVMRHAAASVLLADASKFSRRAIVLVGRLEEFRHVVTDTPPPAHLSHLLIRNNTELTVVV